MDFALTDDQELLRDTARSLLDQRVPAVARARAHRRPDGAADLFWEPPARVGRARRGPLVDLCLFLEEAGAVVAPGPVPRHRRAVRAAARGGRPPSWPTTPWPARSPAPSRWPAPTATGR